MAAEKYSARNLTSHGLDCGKQTLLVALRATARRRPMRPRLAERQIAAEHGESCGAERIGQSDEERGVAVGARAVGQDEGVCSGDVRKVQESAHGYG